MKNAKRIFSLLLVFCMTMALMVPVFAENTETDKGSIELMNPLKDSEGKPVEYTAYKIFDVSYNDDKTAYAYTIAENSPWFSTVSTFATAENGLTLIKVESTTPVLYNVIIDEDVFSAPDFAKALKAAEVEDENGVAFKETKDDQGNATGTVTASGLELGYWMVLPSAGTLASLTTTDKDVKVFDKNEVPEVEKTIDTAVEDTNGKISQANIGDTIPFTLTTKIPDMTGYEKYFFVFNDTLSKGLTFNGTVAVTLDGVAVSADDYNLKVTENEDGTTTVRIVMKDMVKNYSDDQGKALVATYSATLNEDAKSDSANKNTAFMEFSNNPSFNPEYDPLNPPEDPDDPEDPGNDPPEGTDDPYGKGPESETETWTTTLTIIKIDELGNTLTGAKFRLESTTAGNIIITTGENYVPYAPVLYYLIPVDAEPTYTEEKDITDKNLYDPQTYTQVIGASATDISYVAYDEEDVYHKIVEEKVGAWVTIAPKPETKDLYASTDAYYIKSGTGTEDDPYVYELYTAPVEPTIYYKLDDGTFTTDAPNENNWSEYAQEDTDLRDPDFELDKVIKYVKVETTEYVEYTEGTYYKLNDGTYTETAPNEFTEENYASTTTMYKKGDTVVDYEVYVPAPTPYLYYQLKNTAETKVDPADASELVDPKSYIEVKDKEIELNGTYYKQIYTTTEPETEDGEEPAAPVKMVLRDGELTNYAELDTPYYKLKDGTFTSTAPTTEGINRDAYVNDGIDDALVYTVYELIETVSYETKADTPEIAEAFVDENGQLVFKGLAAGTYTLTEVVVPDGYNAIDPLTITVVCNVEEKTAGGYDVKFYINELANDTDEDVKKDDDFMMTMNVVNVNGTKLPETGGMGTVLFVTIGSVLFIATALVLVTKKRLYNEGI